MDNKSQILKRLMLVGLSEREALIYLSLIENGESSIVEISSSTKLNRPAVYQIIPNLLSRQIVSQIKKGKRDFFVANHPDSLETSIKEATTELSFLKTSLSEYAQTHNTTTDIAVFFGKSGIRSVFSDLVNTLNKGDIFYRYSGPTDLNNADEYLPRDYRKIRDAKQLERYVITRDDILQQKKKRLERDIKILPTKVLQHNITKVIYANRVALIDYNKERATVIYDQSNADFERELFMSLWKIL